MIKWTNVSKRAPVTAVIIITVTIIQRKSGTIIRWKSENRHFTIDSSGKSHMIMFEKRKW